ncbi:MAG TPA: hypothetical protein VK453_24335 [Micromonosporaceae bacterium]|nr:hypothetical protein [Micromonosporaceae bacterium]
MAYVVFGDAEAAVVDILRDSTQVDAFNPVISTDLIGYTAGDKWVQVRRTGGIPTLWMHVDNPLIAFDVHADDKGVALDLADAARGAVFAARGYSGRGLQLYDITDTTGLTWAPDEAQPDVPRYQFTLSLVTRPAN